MSAADPYLFDNMNEIGPEVEPLSPVPADVWAKVIDLGTGEPTGYVKRKRWRTYREVFHDLYHELDRVGCPGCGWSDYRKSGEYCKPCPGCGEETEAFIDEYFSLHRYPRETENHPIGPFRFIACYAVTGGSEGHYVHIEFIRDGDRDNHHKIDVLAIGKTFRGWDHAWAMAKECARLLGV